PSMSPALVSASVVAASAATFMTDEATFEAALDGQELRREPFELDDTFNQPEPLIGATTLTLRGLVTTAPSLSWDDYGIGNTGRILLARPTVRFTSPAPTTAASVRIGNVIIEDMQVRMALPNGEMFPVALESAEQRVLGVQSAEPFAYIELTTSSPS